MIYIFKEQKPQLVIYGITGEFYFSYLAHNAACSISNKNALSRCESRLLGDKIRNEEAIRPTSGHPSFVRAMRGERKSKIMLSSNCDSKEK